MISGRKQDKGTDAQLKEMNRPFGCKPEKRYYWIIYSIKDFRLTSLFSQAGRSAR